MHQCERKKNICASVKCNSLENKYPVQYRILHCRLNNIWWLQQLEDWWRGPKGIDLAANIHLNIYPKGVDNKPIMHTNYKKQLESLYNKDARAPKTFVNIIAQPNIQM